MLQVNDTGAGPGSGADDVAGTASRQSSPQQLTNLLLSNGETLSSPPAGPSGAAPAAETDPELLKQQLKLIQLCFAEHEFGIVVDEHDNSNSGSSTSSTSSSSATSSRSSSAASTTSSSSFSVERRGGAAYDPLTFVNDKVHHGVPLAVLSQDLHSYAHYLEDKIAECVNTDVHTAFVNVSGHLVGMRDELSYMERPLAAAMEKLTGAVGQLSTTSHAVKTRVEAACVAEMERNFDAVFLRGVVVYETMTYQLDDLAQLLRMTVDASPSRSPAVGAGGSTISSSHQSSPMDTANREKGMRRDAFSIPVDARLSDSALDILEDVVLLFQELKEVFQRLVSLPSRQQEKADMAAYVSAAEQAVMGVLEVVLVHVSRLAFDSHAPAVESASLPQRAADGGGAVAAAAPSPAARQLLGRVIELYSQAGEREQFCAVFRNAVLRPPLEAVVSWKAATQARQSAESTVALLEQMKAMLQNTYLPLLPLLRENYGAPLHPVATIVWPILSETLVKKLPSLYEVGIPNHFQIKYKAAYGVLATVEAACADLEELAALRQSPDVVLWNHKWNLDVYAALRTSEVGKALQSVTSPLDRLPTSAEGDYHLRLFYIVHQQLQHLFSPSVFLYLCTPRFLRLTVACCYRVLQRVQEAVANLPAGAAGGGPQHGDDINSNGSGSAQSANAPAGTLTAGSGAGGAANDTLLLAISDCHALRGFLSGPLLSLIQTRLQEQAGIVDQTVAKDSAQRDTASLVADVLEFASNTVCAQFVQHARATLVRQVTDAALGPLQNVRSVRSAYSHTRKTMPAAASWYVAPVMLPLQRFAEEARRCRFDGAALQDSVVEMLRVLVGQFVALAKDTLITAKKTEESWEKLRRRKEGSAGGVGGGGGGGGDVSVESPASPLPAAPSTSAASGQRVTMESATDRDKMTIQLWMDARALMQTAQQAPLSVPDAEAAGVFEPAFELLRRAEWIQGANIPEPPDVDA